MKSLVFPPVCLFRGSCKKIPKSTSEDILGGRAYSEQYSIWKDPKGAIKFPRGEGGMNAHPHLPLNEALLFLLARPLQFLNYGVLII